jgi:hypothetical protein
LSCKKQGRHSQADILDDEERLRFLTVKGDSFVDMGDLSLQSVHNFLNESKISSKDQFLKDNIPQLKRVLIHILP